METSRKEENLEFLPLTGPQEEGENPDFAGRCPECSHIDTHSCLFAKQDIREAKGTETTEDRSFWTTNKDKDDPTHPLHLKYLSLFSIRS